MNEYTYVCMYVCMYARAESLTPIAEFVMAPAPFLCFMYSV